MSLPEYSSLAVDRVFPVAYGNEEETGMMESIYNGFEEPYTFVRDYLEYVPDSLLGHNQFLKNGFKYYAGGARGAYLPTNFERATDECRSVKRLVASTRASERLLIQMVEQFCIGQSSTIEDTVEMRIQRRVVDAHGNRKGNHDNFGLPDFSDFDPSDPEFTRPMNRFLACRSFMTGAGLVKSSNLDYAQKVNGLSRVNDYGYFGTMYRYVGDEGSPRFEVRCNDTNISDWATWMRVGSASLMLALLHTPLRTEIEGLHEMGAIIASKRMNRLNLRYDGTIYGNKDVLDGVDFIHKIAVLGMDKLQLYVDELPLDHFKLAKEMYDYCEDYKKVVSRNADIGILGDRADWAAKFSFIIRSIDRDRQHGIKRELTDSTSKAQDVSYDHIGISAKNG